jgi:hypothetical protein
VRQGVHRQIRERQPLPLLRLLRSPEVRPQSLRRRTPSEEEDRAGSHRPARVPVPRRARDQRCINEGERRSREATPRVRAPAHPISAEITRAEEALELYEPSSKASSQPNGSRTDSFASKPPDDRRAQEAELSLQTRRTRAQPPTSPRSPTRSKLSPPNEARRRPRRSFGSSSTSYASAGAPQDPRSSGPFPCRYRLQVGPSSPLHRSGSERDAGEDEREAGDR